MNWLRRFFGISEPESGVTVEGDITIPEKTINELIVKNEAPVVPTTEEITAEVEYSLEEIPASGFESVMRGKARIKYSDGFSEDFSKVYFVSNGEKAMKAKLREDVKTHVEYYRRRKAGKGTWTEKM